MAEIDIETEYLPNVVPFETNPNEGFGTSALRAQAVAARTYAAYFLDHPQDAAYDVDNSVGKQLFHANGRFVMRPAYPASDAAIRDTANYYLALPTDTSAIFSEFGADHSPRDPFNPAPPFYTNPGDFPYLKSVYDPITNGEDRNQKGAGHGRGMSQQGAKKWGRGSNSAGARFPAWDYTRILAHYYTGINMYIRGSIASWGPYRFNVLAFSTDQFHTSTSDDMLVNLQNTGSIPLPQGSKLSLAWQRCNRNDDACTSSSRVEAALALPSGGLLPGDDARLLLDLHPPSGLYQGYADYYYLQQWDVRLPDGRYVASQGWLEQPWTVNIRNTPPAPTPPPSRCGLALGVPCPLNVPSPTVSWGTTPNLDPLVYPWRRIGPDNTTSSGTISAPSVSIALAPGLNDIYVRSQDTTPNHTQSQEVLVERLLYDPEAPLLSLSAPPWSNATSLNVSWSGSDALSGIKEYRLERQANGGAWTTLLDHTTATQYTATNLSDGSDYTFRLTASDKAGNTTVQMQTTSIDRLPPTSRLSGPTGAISKTWVELRWTRSDNRAGIASYSLEVQVNGGAWQLWGTVSGGTQTIFEGAASTTYSWRIRATDQAGNVEMTHASADITFTTGTDSSGLSKMRLPVVAR